MRHVDTLGLVSTGPTASQSTCNGDDDHWADVMRKIILCNFTDAFPPTGARLLRLDISDFVNPSRPYVS